MKWHEFWSEHNADYNRKLSALKGLHDEVPTSEMSKFYADHLASTRDKHKEFNRWWIRENFALLYGHARCWCLELVRRREPGFFGGH